MNFKRRVRTAHGRACVAVIIVIMYIFFANHPQTSILNMVYLHVDWDQLGVGMPVIKIIELTAAHCAETNIVDILRF
jgi:hypothetical protein